MEQARARKLRRLLKSFFSVALCCVLVVAYSYKKPVKAEAALTAATVAGVVVVAAALTALGIGVSAAMNHEDYSTACQHIWNGIDQTVKNQITLTNLAVHDGLAQVLLTQQFLKEVFEGAKSTWPGATYAVAGSFTLSQFQNLTLIPSTVAIDIFNYWSMANSYHDIGYVGKFSVPSFSAGSTATMPLPVLGLTINPHSSLDRFMTLSGTEISAADWILKSADMTSSFCSPAGRYWGNNYNYFSNGSYLPFAVGSVWSLYKAISSSDGKTYFFMTSIDVGISTTYQFEIDGDPGTIAIYGQDVFNPAMDDLFAEGDSVMLNPVDDVIGDIADRVGTQDGSIPITVPVTGDVADTGDIADQQTRTQSDTLGKDIATDADRTADTDYNDTNKKDTTIPKSSSMPKLLLPTGLQKKFPFCLPWDLAACYKLFQVAPKAPVWTIPINIDQGALQVHQTYTYDLNSNHVMDTALPIFKWFVNIGFVLMLIAITRKIME